MSRLAQYFLFILLLLAVNNRCAANHLFGADLGYTHLTGNTYKMTLTLYGDCSADASLVSQLYIAKPTIVIYNGASAVNSLVLSLQSGSGSEVSPVCPREIGNTACNGGTLPGVRRFIYEGNVTLSGASANWRFVFVGRLDTPISVSGIGAGRSRKITNVQNVGTTTMQLTATLNNLNGPNSSPVFGTLPTPFYCINVLQQYNQGAGDPDADSLSFSLVPGINASLSVPAAVTYIFPFSATAPLSTIAGGFSFNRINGQMTFYPDATQDALIVNQVSEYRGGQLVGTSERELTFIVRDNCDGIPPTANITSIKGASVNADGVINICRGESLVKFSIGIDNPDGDSTLFTYTGIPAGASFTVNNNNTPAPTADFSWATGSLAIGNYTFFLTIKNNHCPISNTTTIAYTIRVVDYPTISETLLSATDCTHKAAVAYHLAYGFIPRKVTIVQGGNVVKTYIDSTGNDSSGVVYDSLLAGNYTAIVSSDSVCSTSISFTIPDSGNLNVPDINYSLCYGDPVQPISVTPVAAGATVEWYAPDGTALTGAPSVNTAATGNYYWFFIEKYKTCTSGSVNVRATVHSLPFGQVTDIPHTICYGDKIYLHATGGTNYSWLPADIVKTDTGGPYVEVITPTTVNVIIRDTFQCADTASVTYDDIQLCCNFGYPNAFTPNNDGKNDGYRIYTYGNMLHYNLNIFNRWGQLVFQTGNPKQAWDGTFGGEPCEVGTYFYYLSAQCLTGPKEYHQGDIELIR